MRMTLNLLHELLNAEIFCFFHNCMWQSWHSEVNVYFLELSELVHSRVSPFLFDLCLRFRLCLRICLQVQQTLAHNSGWILVHPQFSPFLLSFWCLHDQTRHLFRSPGWTVAHPRVSPFLIIGFLIWVGFVGVFAASSDFWIQFFHPIIFKGNLWRRPRWQIYFLVYDFSRFHHNNFRDTISWECVIKDDCVRSCLIELQSFPLSKLYIDPIHRVLVSFPRFLLVPCKTWFGQVKLVRIFVFLVHGIHSRKEHCLSFPA